MCSVLSVYGVHSSPKDNCPASIISLKVLFTLLGVGLQGIAISPPGSHLCCDAEECGNLAPVCNAIFFSKLFYNLPSISTPYTMFPCEF